MKSSKCKNCESEFVPSDPRGAKFCCRECYLSFKQSNSLKKKTKKCKNCESDFIASSGQIYCSAECRPIHKTICSNCNTEFQSSPSTNRKYCSKKCEGESKTKKRYKINCKTCNTEFESKNKNSKYCSNDCRFKRITSPKIEKPCQQCGESVFKTQYQLSKIKNVFCSCSCRAKYYIQRRKNTRRSKAEDYLESLINKKFPEIEVKCNDRSVLECHYEIDIWIPDCELAIELNGPTHYFNIYGQLDEIQKRDSIKTAEMIDRGFKLITIDISTISDFNKVKCLVKDVFNNQITPILLGKIK